MVPPKNGFLSLRLPIFGASYFHCFYARGIAPNLGTGKMGYNWNRICVGNKCVPIWWKFSSHIIALGPPDRHPPIWPPFWRLKVQLDLFRLLTCISFGPIFRICSFQFHSSIQHFVKHCHCHGSFITCFSTSWAMEFAEIAVDFVYNLHFQVKLEK